MVWVLAGLALVLALVWLARSFASSDPRRVASTLRVLGGIGALAIGGFLLMRGMVWAAIPLFGFGLGMFVWPQGRGEGRQNHLTIEGEAEDITDRLSPEEAREILGVGPDASVGEITEAHRHLLENLPDSQWAAAEERDKLNRALQALLDQTR